MFSSLLLEFFQDALPLWVKISCSRDGRRSLSRSCCHSGMIPESDGLVNRCLRISLGRSVVDMDVMELIKVSWCCDMNEDMSLEPRRLNRATLGHLTGRPWMVLRIFWWTRSSISDSVLDIVQSSHPYSMMGRVWSKVCRR